MTTTTTPEPGPVDLVNSATFRVRSRAKQNVDAAKSFMDSSISPDSLKRVLKQKLTERTAGILDADELTALLEKVEEAKIEIIVQEPVVVHTQTRTGGDHSGGKNESSSSEDSGELILLLVGGGGCLMLIVILLGILQYRKVIRAEQDAQAQRKAERKAEKKEKKRASREGGGETGEDDVPKEEAAIEMEQGKMGGISETKVASEERLPDGDEPGPGDEGKKGNLVEVSPVLSTTPPVEEEVVPS